MAAAATALALTAGAQAQSTDVEELVMYGIDADTHELLRYTFDTDEFIRIGVVVDQNGHVIDHPECMTYIPSGPHRGFYAIPSGKDGTGGPEYALVKINGMDGSAWAFPDDSIGYQRLCGATAMQDPGGKWWIVASARTPDDCLVWIDPEDGVAKAELNTHELFEGLALHPDPTKLYGNTTHVLYEISLTSDNEVQLVDLSSWSRVESLETAFGDFGPAIDIPGVDASWTANGALFAFSDDRNALLVLNPTGNTVAEYNCSFVTVDCEGLVFLTQASDPFGKVVVDAHD